MISATVLAVLVVSLLVGELLVRRSGPHLPTQTSTHWIVDSAPRRTRAILHRLDRRVAGGAVVAAGFVAVGATAVLLGALLDTIDDGALGDWDMAIAEWGSERSDDGSTALLEILTRLGGTSTLLVALIVVGAFGTIRLRRRGSLWYLATVGVGISLLNNGLKWLIDRDRPDVDPLTGYAGASFPSGHTAAAAACWAAVAVVVGVGARRPRRRLLAVAAVSVALMVAATRVLLGVHWATDVVAGLAVGWTWWFVVTLAFGTRWLELGRPVHEAAEATLTPPSSTSPRTPTPPRRHAGRRERDAIDPIAWKASPVDGVGLAGLAGVHIGLSLLLWAIGAAIVNWWDRSRLGTWDAEVVEWFVRRRSEGWTRVADIGSGFADTIVIVALGAAALPLCLWLFRRWHEYVVVFAAAGLETLVYLTSGSLVGRERPQVERLGDAPTTSFPSGHIAAATALYGGLFLVVVLRTRRTAPRVVAGVFAALVIVWVVLARFYAGMHFPTDAIGGVALGAAALATLWWAVHRTLAGDSLLDRDDRRRSGDDARRNDDESDPDPSQRRERVDVG